MLCYSTGFGVAEVSSILKRFICLSREVKAEITDDYALIKVSLFITMLSE